MRLRNNRCASFGTLFSPPVFRPSSSYEMPERPEPPASLAQAETRAATKNPFAKAAKSRVSGLNAQEGIKSFFGANALISVLVLLAICGFLATQAFNFLPDYHKELKNYRKTGLEYVGLLEHQFKKQKELYALIDTAYSIERQDVGRAELAEMLEFNALYGEAQDEAIDTYDEWEEAFDTYEEAQEEADDLNPDTPEAERVETLATLQEAQALEQTLRAQWKAEVKDIVDDAGQPDALDDAAWADLKNAVLAMEPDAGISPYVSNRQQAVDAAMGDLKTVRDELKSSLRPLESVWLDLRDVALENKAQAEKFSSAPKRLAALRSGLEFIKDPEAKAAQQAEIDMIEEELVEPAWRELTEPMYQSKPRAKEASATLIDSLADSQPRLPDPESLTAEKARDAMEDAVRIYDDVEEDIAAAAAEAQEWSCDRAHSFFSTLVAFFFGSRWETNSTFQDFYGLLPLLAGSALISLIALTFAVPIGVASAVYVNQLAKPAEASMIKPLIEFVQAIPSVVLGIFGILVLGPALVELSQTPWLSWVPGFPMEDSLNALNAGLLLAFMAVPTIFTLAEDAINNVPRSYRDASFALGATKLQTTTRVIVPTAITGIIAAILLGLGRVIGETMVVLLVAGNRISIPDFGAGLGVIVQPVHTMTGLIAQETGEVTRGTLHWGALFAVGLVLFTISLLINGISQYLINRRQTHG